jgi:hypothetical protein
LAIPSAFCVTLTITISFFAIIAANFDDGIHSKPAEVCMTLPESRILVSDSDAQSRSAHTTTALLGRQFFLCDLAHYGPYSSPSTPCDEVHVHQNHICSVVRFPLATGSAAWMFSPPEENTTSRPYRGATINPRRSNAVPFGARCSPG